MCDDVHHNLVTFCIRPIPRSSGLTKYTCVVWGTSPRSVPGSSGGAKGAHKPCRLRPDWGKGSGLRGASR